MSTQPSLNPSFGGQTSSEGAINRNNQSEGAVTATQPQPPEWCSAHLERRKEFRPVHALGLCYSCFKGVSISPKEELGANFFRPCPPREARVFVINVPLYRTEDVMESVAKIYGVTVNDIMTHSNSPYYSQPRGVVMFILRRALRQSLPMIGKRIGVHHTTAMYHVRKVTQMMQDSEEVRGVIEPLVAHFSAVRGQNSVTQDGTL